MKLYSKINLALLSSLTLAVTISGCSASRDDNNDGTPAITSPAATSVKVTATTPTNAATGVPINRKLTVAFNELMNASTVTIQTFTLVSASSVAVTGVVTYAADSGIFTFSPSANLEPSTVYTATVSVGTKSAAGNTLASNYVWTFTTDTGADSTAPAVTTAFPAGTPTDVAINRQLSVTFDEAIDPTSVTSETYSVVDSHGVHVVGTFSYLGTTVRFLPTQALSANTVYTVTVTTGVKDLAGNALPQASVWTFTTGSIAAKGPSPVPLGTAGEYVILAKSAISTTGTTAIVGDLGLSPAAQSFMTGFSETLDSTNVFANSILVTGKMFAADMAVPTPSKLTTAISDMEIAFTDAAGRVTPDFDELGAGDISGKTLVPGLYNWGTGLAVTSDITLAGGANDVWIFQIAQDITVGNGVKVTLSGGALPKNIFWQVSGQVSLGTTAEFKGVILGKTQINLNTGAVLNGRALAQTAVTLNANTVTQPTP